MCECASNCLFSSVARFLCHVVICQTHDTHPDHKPLTLKEVTAKYREGGTFEDEWEAALQFYNCKLCSCVHVLLHRSFCFCSCCCSCCRRCGRRRPRASSGRLNGYNVYTLHLMRKAEMPSWLSTWRRAKTTA